MKKKSLYIVLLFLSAVLADWITIEHDFNICNQAVPSNYAAFHIDEDGVSYTSSFMIRRIENVKHEPPVTIVNVTMWGCTFDCSLNYLVELNRDDFTVSSYTSIDKKNSANYKCKLSNYTMTLVPTPKITYQALAPNPDHIFPTDLTAKYCSQGIHPDKRTWTIPATENVAECIDHLTGSEVGTYALSLEFGSGSSYKPDGFGVATYHMIDSTNKLFNYWERHHRGFHDALNDLSLKMTPENLQDLAPPPPPPPKINWLLDVVLPAVGAVLVFAIPMAGPYVVGAIIARSMAEVAEIAAEMAEAYDVVVSSIEGSVEREAAEEFIASSESGVVDITNEVYRVNNAESILRVIESNYLGLEGDLESILRTLAGSPIHVKRDTSEPLGFFSTNMINQYVLPTVMDNVHQSFTGGGQTYSDISSYLSGAREHLLYHFNDTLHSNFFAGNKSLISTFTAHEVGNNNKLLSTEDDVYNHIKTSTYNTMAASIISIVLQQFKVEICDPKPEFCGQECDDDGHTYFCPTMGKDNCVITAADSQIKELNFLRDTSDICSNNQTGWNITHNPNCDESLFKCQ